MLTLGKSGRDLSRDVSISAWKYLVGDPTLGVREMFLNSEHEELGRYLTRNMTSKTFVRATRPTCLFPTKSWNKMSS